jgi:hypothetical protein
MPVAAQLLPRRDKPEWRGLKDIGQWWDKGNELARDRLLRPGHDLVRPRIQRHQGDENRQPSGPKFGPTAHTFS